MPPTVQQKFSAALDALIEQVKGDRSVLAAILCGSLSHDTVWAKSDIDLVLVTIDDKKTANGDLALYADGVNVHALLMPRAEFRKIGGRVDPQLVHALVSGQGAAALHPRRDDRRAVRGAAESRRARYAECSSWARRPTRCHRSTRPTSGSLTRGDLDYTALWILYAANAAGEGRGAGGAAAGGPRGDAAGDEAESRRSSRRSTPTCSTRRRRGRPWRARWRRSTATWRSARRRCSRR